MTALRETQDAALEPARTAMLRRAADQAERIVGLAREEAEVLIARARQDAEAEVTQARAEGAAQARPVAAAELSRSRRAARSVALRARLSVRDELAGRIREAVSDLRHEAGYPLLRERLAEMARHAAGPGAVVTDHPDGGVVARADVVVVNCSLPRLADQVIEALGPRIDRICAS
ncbi:MAG TPA: V-type ATP synthase subunit E family protein [Streptosporangiaceae bacterium]